MSDKRQEDFLQKLHDSKINYINSLPSKISEIRLIWNQLNTSVWRVEVLLKMKNLAHNLAGSGGTFGFPLISTQAKALELALGELTSYTETRPEPEKCQAIDDLLIELQRIELETMRESESPVETLTTNNTIAILDQDKKQAINLMQQLLTYGCNAKTICETDKLEAELKRMQPMVILIDAKFAETTLNNRTLVQVIRKDWNFTCPIVYLSDNDTFENRMQAIKATANAYFTKPIDVALLIERINILTNTSVLEPYRILIMEDDENLAKYYALILEKGGMKVTIEVKPERILETILQINPELVVMDLYMPNYNGIELIKLIRQHQALYTLPVVLLTSETDADLQFLAREVGVDDILSKPIEAVHFFDSVLTRVQRARYTNISMSTDSLTGLFTHKKIYEQLRMALNFSSRYGRPLVYTIIDIDNFKQINDTYGHLIGDDVLIALSNCIKSSIRASDVVGRYGGEEFVIIFLQTSESEALESLERLRLSFSNVAHHSGGAEFHVTFSAGMASYPKYGDINAIMATADQALYRAKDNGKNQIAIG